MFYYNKKKKKELYFSNNSLSFYEISIMGVILDEYNMKKSLSLSFDYSQIYYI